MCVLTDTGRALHTQALTNLSPSFHTHLYLYTHRGWELVTHYSLSYYVYTHTFVHPQVSSTIGTIYIRNCVCTCVCIPCVCVYLGRESCSHTNTVLLYTHALLHINTETVHACNLLYRPSCRDRAVYAHISMHVHFYPEVVSHTSLLLYL